MTLEMGSFLIWQWKHCGDPFGTCDQWVNECNGDFSTVINRANGTLDLAAPYNRSHKHPFRRCSGTSACARLWGGGLNQHENHI
jgi:hypothetical protein